MPEDKIAQIKRLLEIERKEYEYQRNLPAPNALICANKAGRLEVWEHIIRALEAILKENPEPKAKEPPPQEEPLSQMTDMDLVLLAKEARTYQDVEFLAKVLRELKARVVKGGKDV